MRKSNIAPVTEACRAHLEVIAYNTYLQLDEILQQTQAPFDADDRATLFAQLVAKQAEAEGCLTPPPVRRKQVRFKSRR